MRLPNSSLSAGTRAEPYLRVPMVRRALVWRAYHRYAIGQSTRIYNRESGEVSYGRVPAGSVVVSGSLPAADGSHSLYCAVIVKQVDEKTRAKTSLNELIRQADD